MMIDEDQSIYSEIIWTFNDVDRELLKRYPNGHCLSEELVTIDGAYTWRVDFYPNGKDLKTYGRVIVCVELVGALDPQSQVDAECQFSLKNRKRRKHYMGKINLRAFELGHYEEDSSFENVILKECGSGQQPILVTIGITQHPSGYTFIPAQAYIKSSSSTHSLNNICEEIGEGGSCGISWAPSNSKSVTDLVAESLMMNNRALIGLSHLAAGEKPKLCREMVDLSKGLYRNHQDEFLKKKPNAANYLYSQI